MYKTISFSEHSHQNGMTGDKTGNLLGRKNKTKLDSNNGGKFCCKGLRRSGSLLAFWHEKISCNALQLSFLKFMMVANKPHMKNQFLKSLCIPD